MFRSSKKNRFHWIRAQKIHFNHLVEYELPLNDRTTIQELHSEGYSNRAIARELNCSPSTVGYELK
ncbi:helix-turn-helix domain-containing protein, partial [Lactobacillus delbrueckii subsp. bulgaricus]